MAPEVAAALVDLGMQPIGRRRGCSLEDRRPQDLAGSRKMTLVQRMQAFWASLGLGGVGLSLADGMGYAKEYHVERYLRESWIPRLAPVSPQLILCFIAEKVLGLPKSY